MDWSFDLCSPQQRLLWARLSVFSGDFGLEAAESVCAGDGLAAGDVFPLLAGLVDKSILVREEHGPGCGTGSWRRYGSTAGSDCRPGQELPYRRRHRDWYLRLAQQAEAAWLSPDQVEWLTGLQAERANLRVALDFCLSDPGEARSGLEIAAALWGHWIFAGSLGEGRRGLDAALALAPEPSTARAKALWVTSWLALLQGDVAAALPRLEECRALGQQLDDPSARAHADQYGGLAALFQRDFPGAVTLLKQALARYRAMADENAEWITLYQLAAAAAVLGDARAGVIAAECLELCTSRGASWSRSYALWVVGLERWRNGAYGKAAAALREGIRLKRPFQDQWGIALCLEALAWTLAADRRDERAAHLLGAAQTVWRLNGTSLSGLGHIVGFHEQCEASLRHALGDQAFQAAFRRGTQFTLERALGYALGDGHDAGLPGQRRPEEPPSAGTATLTRREREIAGLVAQGMSNRQIAAKLVIAQRTAEAHVEHMLSKLGFTARTQITAWVAEHHDSAPGG